jgi:hypothetical protein
MTFLNKNPCTPDPIEKFNVTKSDIADYLRQIETTKFILQLIFKLPNDNTPLFDFSKYQYVFDNDNMIVNFNLYGIKSLEQFQILKVKEVYNQDDYTVLHATPDVDYFDQFGQWQSLSYFVVHRDKQVFPNV